MSLLSFSLLFIVTLLIAITLSPVVINIAKKANLDDTINERSAHTTPTPRGGGLIFILTMAALLLANLLFSFLDIPEHVILILCSSFGCAMIGFLDDKYTLPSWLRLCAQVLLVTYPALHLPLLSVYFPPIIQYALYIISWVWFINLFNFMDGTDGYASQEALYILLLMIITTTGLVPLSLCLMAAVLGFLKVNYPKASIFMGDAGSYFLGYLLFGLMIYSFTQNPHMFVPCMIVSLLFTADATYTLIKRVIKRESFFSAHRSHWYQRLYNLGYSHTYIFWLGVAVNSILLCLSLFAFYIHHIVVDITLCTFCLVMLSAFIVRKEKSRNFGST